MFDTKVNFVQTSKDAEGNTLVREIASERNPYAMFYGPKKELVYLRKGKFYSPDGKEIPVPSWLDLTPYPDGYFGLKKPNASNSK